MNTPALDRLLRTSVPLFGEGRAASRCTEKVLVPFVNTDFPDPDFPGNSGTVNQKLMRSFVGLSGESRSVDANQSYFHASAVPPGAAGAPGAAGLADQPAAAPSRRAVRDPGARPTWRRPGANLVQSGGLNPRGASEPKRVGRALGRVPARRLIKRAAGRVDDWYERILERRAKALRKERKR